MNKSNIKNKNDEEIELFKTKVLERFHKKL
jgi:hypothetical protein